MVLADRRMAVRIQSFYIYESQECWCPIFTVGSQNRLKLDEPKSNDGTTESRKYVGLPRGNH